MFNIIFRVKKFLNKKINTKFYLKEQPQKQQQQKYSELMWNLV